VGLRIKKSNNDITKKTRAGNKIKNDITNCCLEILPLKEKYLTKFLKLNETFLKLNDF
tara:strand:+ start:1155 stop:1328 length:174 start_codon:yes stop_codon:yes gene_type:complete